MRSVSARRSDRSYRHKEHVRNMGHLVGYGIHETREPYLVVELHKAIAVAGDIVEIFLMLGGLAFLLQYLEPQRASGDPSF